MSAQLLDDERIGQLGHEQKELLHSIRDDADRLLKITGELLNMSQVETGNIQLKLQTSFPKSIVDQAIQAVNLQAQQKNVSIKTNIDHELPNISADMEKSAWVLINFLTNAIKFSSEGNEVLVSVTKNGQSVRFSVLDHGRGIEEKYLPKIFDRYFKVPGTHERSGTGLGLAISKEFIEAQGGQIWVESKLGEGSIFGFSLKSVGAN
jgi:signal transduction histidine kinase